VESNFLHGRRETEKERRDRNLLELTSELRVALPGVQVLFAFLLVVPFNSGFDDVSAFQETVYFATLMLAAAASALLIAPSLHHRIYFRQEQKEWILVVGNRLAIAGLAALGLAMTGVVMLVSDFVFGPVASALCTVGIAALFVTVWWWLPLRRGP
jgi:hypothetical protein